MKNFTIKHAREAIMNEYNINEFEQVYGVSISFFYKYMKNYDIIITYDSKSLQEEIEQYFVRVPTQKFKSELNITHNQLYQMGVGVEVSYKKLVKLLNYFDVKYKLNLIENNNSNGGNFKCVVKANLYSSKYYLEKEAKKKAKKDYARKDLKPYDFKIKENTNLVMNHRENIEGRLQTSKVNASLIQWVLEQYDSGIREAALFGIKSERLGKGKKLENSISKEFTLEK